MTFPPPDRFGRNIFYRENDSERDIPYYTFLTKRPALAMMAVLVSEIISDKWDIPVEKFTVNVLESPPAASLQVLPRGNLTPKQARRMDGFLRLMRDTATGNPNVQEFVPESNQVITLSDRAMSNYLKAMMRRAGLAPRPRELRDPEHYHACFTRSEEPWQLVALRGLRYPWVLAAMPEGPYVSEEHMLADVYRTLQSTTFDFDRIDSMILKDERAKDGDRTNKERPEPYRDLIFNIH